MKKQKIASKRVKARSICKEAKWQQKSFLRKKKEEAFLKISEGSKKQTACQGRGKEEAGSKGKALPHREEAEV